MWAPLLALRRIAGMGKKKPSFYAVAVGRRTGIYKTWPECQAQVSGASGAKFKSFHSQEDAVQYMCLYHRDYTYKPATFPVNAVLEGDAEDVVEAGKEGLSCSVPAADKEAPWWERATPEPEEESSSSHAASSSSISQKRGANGEGEKPKSSKRSKTNVVKIDTEVDGPVESVSIRGKGVRTIEVYTDGASSSNGKTTAMAGWGVYWPESEDAGSDLHNLNESERLPGVLQTNNRAELMGIIRAIQLCPDPEAQLVIYTDSQYCIKAINEWQRNWRKNKWVTSKQEPVLNKDLIRLLERELRGRTLRPTLIYVKGHSSSKGNQEADRLAVQGACKPAVAPHLWKDLEPSESEDETPKLAYQKAVNMWRKHGFTIEQAKTRAGPEPSS